MTFLYKKITLSLLLALLINISAREVSAASATLNASATIISAPSVQAISAMSFGTITVASPTQAASAVMDTGSDIVIACTNCIAANDGVSRGGLRITGLPSGTAVQVSVGGTAIPLSAADGSAGVAVSGIHVKVGASTLDFSSSAGSQAALVPADGTLTVSGVLDIPAGTVGAVYNGSLLLSVNF
jgi:hypothetical protein